MVRFNRPGTGGEWNAQQMVKALNDMEGINNAHIAESGQDYVIEWQMHDPDSEYTSALTIDRDRGKLMGMTLRFGPLGEWEKVNHSTESDLEGTWWDVVFTAEERANVTNFIPKRGIDLGHKYISDFMRPHIRLTRKPEGYDKHLDDVVNFIREINLAHKEEFGDLEGRMMDPEFADYFSQR